MTLVSRFPQIIVYSEAKVRNAIRKAEANIIRRAQERSRVDTGYMRGGWQSRVISSMEGIVYNLVEYTIYNEFGTVNMAAQPMLRPAVEETREEFESDIREAYI